MDLAIVVTPQFTDEIITMLDSEVTAWSGSLYDLSINLLKLVTFKRAVPQSALG